MNKPGPKPAFRKCSLEECNRPHRAGGYCLVHYQRWRKHGDPKAFRPISKSKFGMENGRWKGGEVNDGHGRILMYCPGHPNASYGGTHVYRYRLVMEKHLGRFLNSDEIVHHINGDQADDRVENLMVMSQAEHARLHRRIS